MGPGRTPPPCQRAARTIIGEPLEPGLDASESDRRASTSAGPDFRALSDRSARSARPSTARLCLSTGLNWSFQAGSGERLPADWARSWSGWHGPARDQRVRRCNRASPNRGAPRRRGPRARNDRGRSAPRRDAPHPRARLRGACGGHAGLHSSCRGWGAGASRGRAQPPDGVGRISRRGADRP